MAELEDLTVAELEAILDESRDNKPRSYLKEVMAVRNAKIETAEAELYGLTREGYAELRAKSEAANAAERDHHAAVLASLKAQAVRDAAARGLEGMQIALDNLDPSYAREYAGLLNEQHRKLAEADAALEAATSAEAQAKAAFEEARRNPNPLAAMLRGRAVRAEAAGAADVRGAAK